MAAADELLANGRFNGKKEDPLDIETVVVSALEGVVKRSI
jgi:hypothetical protein